MRLAQAKKKFGRLKVALAADGVTPLMVIRPDNPALALMIADIAIRNNDGALLDRLPGEVGDYKIVGWKSATPGALQYVVDRDGMILDELQAGDSFVVLDEENIILRKKGVSSRG